MSAAGIAGRLAGTGVALVGIAAICLAAPGYYGFLVGTVATTAIIGVGLNILLGLAGEVSLGHAGFMSMGAYGVAILTTKAGFGFWAALPVAVTFVAIVGAVLSIPALRVTGPYLAMVTIAFGFIVDSATVEWSGLTGGASGIGGIPQPFAIGGMALTASVVCTAMLFAFAALKRSPLGLAMQAASAAPAAARSVGISLLPVRTAAFILSAAAGGLAGCLQAGLTGFIAPSSFPFTQSILFLLVVVLGGAGRTLGPLYGALAVGLLPELLSSLAEYRLLVFGAALLVVLWLAPDGIAGVVERFSRRLRHAGRPTQASPAQALVHIGGSGGGLRVDGLGVSFGGVAAVAGVDVVAPARRITSLIGPNGAGKTTLLNLVSGFQAVDTGTVHVGELAVTGAAAHRVARAGLARTFQTAQMFDGLSVLDNVRLGLLGGRWRGAAGADLARSLLRFVGYAGADDGPAGALPHVDRRLVEIARALATSPKIVLLDEPAAGLDAADTGRLEGVLRRIAGAGLAVLLVEHDMSLVMSVSDEIVVLDAGRRIATGPPAAIRTDPAVVAAYLGTTAPAPRPPRHVTGGPFLDVRNVKAGYGPLRVLDGISLEVRKGEAIAVLGPNGAGKSTLMKALSGLLRPVGGTIAIDGQLLQTLAADRVARMGLTLVPEGRQVFPNLTSRENMQLGATRLGHLDPVLFEAVLVRFPRLRPLLDRRAALLSGGEQQMLVVARGLLSEPKILLLDEPSLGLAPAIATELFHQLAELADEGMTLVVVDQMAEHTLAMADRGYVVEGGQIKQAGSADALRAAALHEIYFGAGETGRLETEPEAIDDGPRRS